jgi:HlyD family secretion protein
MNDQNAPSGDPETAQVLEKIGKARAPLAWRIARVLLLVVVLAAIGIAWGLFQKKKTAGNARQFITAPLEKGTLTTTVTATGSLEGEGTVVVGAEISGRVKTVLVDFNESVKKGQLLAEIDPEQHRANRDQARAQLSAARAELKNRQASADEARLAAERVAALAKDGLVAKAELESARAAAARGAAAVESARAQITVAEATLSSSETALSRTLVKSPIDGIVLSRTVEPGQTVVAAMQSPVLFTIAQDLRQMILTVAIDEADIGRVKVGQEATFTVDAFPGKRFPTSLRAIHNVSVLKDNIVTYAAELAVSNPELLLRPGMTATVTIVTEAHADVLLVKNAALRFTPPSDEKRVLLPGAPPGAGQPQKKSDDEKGPAVWVLRDGEPARVRVKTGLSDGERTEITGEGLSVDDEVILDVLEAKK